MSGKFAPFRGIVGTSILKFFNLTIATTGINEQKAKELGFDYEAFKLSLAILQVITLVLNECTLKLL